MSGIISQITVTVQGEGPSAGSPCLLIRLGNCNLNCEWCFIDGTQIRTKDGYKNISEIKIGDKILGINQNKKMKTIEETTVYNISSREDQIVLKLKLVDGTELIGTSEHPILMNNGYKPMFRKLVKLQPGDLVYKLQDCEEGIINDEYKQGWLAGYWNGDGSFYTQKHHAGPKFQNKCRAASIDDCVVERNYTFCQDLGINVRIVDHHSTIAFKNSGNHCKAVTCTTDSITLQLKDLVEEDLFTYDWCRGYIAGIFDAEGSFDGYSLRISQITKLDIIDRIEQCLQFLEIEYFKNEKGFNINEGKFAAIRFDKEFQCVNKRKFEKLYPVGLNFCERVEVESVDILKRQKVHNISTDAETFIANNILVHNCDTKWSNNLKINEVPHLTSLTENLPFKIETENEMNLFMNTCKNHIKDYNIDRALITGGEPFMDINFLAAIITFLRLNNNIRFFEIETNGTLITEEKLNVLVNTGIGVNLQLNFSPKLNPDFYRNENIKTLDDILESFKEMNKLLVLFNEAYRFIINHNYKFVYDKNSEKDIDEFIKVLCNGTAKIYVMPNTPDYLNYTDEFEFIKDFRKSCYDTIDYCLRKGHMFSPRMHVFVFNNFLHRDEFEDVVK